MKPFAAWLAMGHSSRPYKRVKPADRGGYYYQFEAFTNRRTAKAHSSHNPQRVLIVPDTEENRRKLGMEE